MNDHAQPHPPPDARDELVDSLPACGGVLSQIISGMVEWEASGRSAPGSAPIPEVAHAIIRDVGHSVSRLHSKRDLRVAATIVSQMTTAMSEEIYAVDMDWYDAVTDDDGDAPSQDSA